MPVEVPLFGIGIKYEKTHLGIQRAERRGYGLRGIESFVVRYFKIFIIL